MNPLLQSGIALAGANRKRTGRGGSGILTAEEIASFEPGRRGMGCSSACDTGLGAVKDGEGVFGFRRAFQLAGARTVIMSLWTVEDESTVSGNEWTLPRTAGAARNDGRRRKLASVAILKERRAKD